jgi:hypothetical protein
MNFSQLKTYLIMKYFIASILLIFCFSHLMAQMAGSEMAALPENTEKIKKKD